MGYYIEVPRPTEKARQIVELHGATHVHRPEKLSDIPADRALIVVVENGIFDAAALAYNQSELDAFTSPSDRRPKTFLMMEKNLAHKLARYEERI